MSKPRPPIWTALALLCAVAAWSDEVSRAEGPGDSANFPTVRIGGTVLDTDRKPLDAFRLMVFRRGGGEPEVIRFRGAAGVLDAQVDTSAYAIAIDAARHARWFAGLRFVSGGTHDLGEVPMQRERVLRGRVVASANGAPIADAGIKFVPRSARAESSLEQLDHWSGTSAVTDADGRFELRGLPQHGIQLEVRAPGHAGRSVGSPAGAERLDIELGVGATIEGSLTLASGEPVRGTVRLVPTLHWLERMERQVDSLGGFRFDKLRSGAYMLVANTDAGAVEMQTVSVADNEHLVVELPVDPLGRLSGSLAGLAETQSATIRVLRRGPDAYWRNAGSFGNGLFEVNGIPDGDYIIEADVGELSLERKVRMVDGTATVHFEFDEGSRLTGKVLAGNRPLPGVYVGVIPVRPELPSGGVRADSEGRFEVGRLPDGDYRVRVRLGLRGTYRSFDVTVTGDTMLDVRLGPHRLSGQMLGERTSPDSSLRGSSRWMNHVVQAVLLDADDEPVVFRGFVDSRGMYSFDGLEEGRYAVSHGHPYYVGTVREVSVFGEWVEGVDFDPGSSEIQPVQWLDGESGEVIGLVDCEIHEGPWAGITQRVENHGFPTSLAGVDMTCSSQGYKPVHFRWDGEPIEMKLERAGS